MHFRNPRAILCAWESRCGGSKGKTHKLAARSGVWNSFHNESFSSFPASVSLKRHSPNGVSYRTSIAKFKLGFKVFLLLLELLFDYFARNRAEDTKMSDAEGSASVINKNKRHRKEKRAL